MTYLSSTRWRKVPCKLHATLSLHATESMKYSQEFKKKILNYWSTQLWIAYDQPSHNYMNLRNLSGVRILWNTIYAQQGRLVLQQYSYTLTLKWSRSCQQCRIRFSIKWKWLLITSLICPTKKSRIYSTKLLSPANRVNLTITNPRVGWKRCKEINRANYL